MSQSAAAVNVAEQLSEGKRVLLRRTLGIPKTDAHADMMIKRLIVQKRTRVYEATHRRMRASFAGARRARAVGV